MSSTESGIGAQEPIAEKVPTRTRRSSAPMVVPHLSVAERAARGRAARKEVPRQSHADFSPGAHRADPVELSESQAVSRVAELVPIRYGRMLVSPFTFYRGAALIMAADLAPTPHSGLRTQLCGDAHLSNFGVFAAPDRRLVFDINDFDETLPVVGVGREAVGGEYGGGGPRQRVFGEGAPRDLVGDGRWLSQCDARLRGYGDAGRVVRAFGNG